jgi:hypothetical protein
MNRSRSTSLITLAAFAALTPSWAFAQTKSGEKKHESNTLKKAGKAVEYSTKKAGKAVERNASKAAKSAEYGVRKGGENVSVTTHRALGKNSVVRDRGKKQDYVVTPDGKHIPIKDKGAAKAKKK